MAWNVLNKNDIVIYSSINKLQSLIIFIALYRRAAVWDVAYNWCWEDSNVQIDEYLLLGKSPPFTNLHNHPHIEICWVYWARMSHFMSSAIAAAFNENVRLECRGRSQRWKHTRFEEVMIFVVIVNRVSLEKNGQLPFNDLNPSMRYPCYVVCHQSPICLILNIAELRDSLLWR